MSDIWTPDGRGCVSGDDGAATLCFVSWIILTSCLRGVAPWKNGTLATQPELVNSFCRHFRNTLLLHPSDGLRMEEDLVHPHRKLIHPVERLVERNLSLLWSLSIHQPICSLDDAVGCLMELLGESLPFRLPTTLLRHRVPPSMGPTSSPQTPSPTGRSTSVSASCKSVDTHTHHSRGNSQSVAPNAPRVSTARYPRQRSGTVEGTHQSPDR